MANGRCRIHGGTSTGPKTQEGIENIRKAQWKHVKSRHDRIRVFMVIVERLILYFIDFPFQENLKTGQIICY